MLLWLKKKKKVVLRHILCKKVTPPQQLSPRYCLLQFKNPCKACFHTCFLWSCSSSAFALTVNHRSCDVSSRSPPHKTTQRQTHNTHRHKDNTQCPTMYSTHTHTHTGHALLSHWLTLLSGAFKKARRGKKSGLRIRAELEFPSHNNSSVAVTTHGL